jgi:hypothetical protein
LTAPYRKLDKEYFCPFCGSQLKGHYLDDDLFLDCENCRKSSNTYAHWYYGLGDERHPDVPKELHWEILSKFDDNGHAVWTLCTKKQLPILPKEKVMFD